MTSKIYLWLGFGLFVMTIMVLDLGVFHRKARHVSMREAAAWTAVWVSLALVFNGVIYFWLGKMRAIEFLTGYIIEWSLSMDNVFVFAVIFSYFAVPSQYQYRVLFWGILGAVVMRLVVIIAGAALLDRFHWLIYPMGGFLVLTGIKLFLDRNRESDVSKNWLLCLARRWLPVTAEYVGQKFFVRGFRSEIGSIILIDGDRVARQVFVRRAARWMVTPLLLVLLVVETTDVAFAVDSIPAIFAVTRDPFIVFTSNVFAILGLRALYFLLAGAMQMFRFLSVGLAAILCFVGSKMLISGYFDIPTALSLGVICCVLVAAVAASLVVARVEESRGAKTTTHKAEPVEVLKVH